MKFSICVGGEKYRMATSGRVVCATCGSHIPTLLCHKRQIIRWVVGRARFSKFPRDDKHHNKLRKRLSPKVKMALGRYRYIIKE